MKPRLFTALMASLLCAGALPCFAHELSARDPARASLVDAARNTRVSGLPADSSITLSRAWVEGSHGKVCAVARRADGELLIQDGDLQLKRVELRKRGSGWGVERAERMAMNPNMSLDEACHQPSSEAIMTAAIKGLQDHPPAAGIKTTTGPVASAACDEPVRPLSSTPLSGPGLVVPAGRSLLHTLPDTQCRMGKHIVQGDKVVLLAQVPGWTQVRYTHPITHVVTIGWLKSERVKPNTSADSEGLASND
ncbi:MAG: hypothetical protein KGL57_07585 [Burkholderiales bacterium]|nr:hypothetical protein [Burkholderiales bacterium]